MRHSFLYTLGFSAVLCLVCAVLVSSAAVGLKTKQDLNRELDRRRNVLEASGMIEPGQTMSKAEIDRFFESAEAVLVDLETGREVEGDVASFDQQKTKKNPDTSHEAPENPARVFRLPDQALVYKMFDETGALETVVLPIEGYGLWGTLYGYLALDSDLETVVGITYYEHKETPGLGGEVDNARWKALWPERKAFDEAGLPALTVIKGPAGPAADDPYRVDGLSGATITSRGVTNMLSFWLGPDGFGPYLDQLREGGVA